MGLNDFLAALAWVEGHEVWEELSGEEGGNADRAGVLSSDDGAAGLAVLLHQGAEEGRGDEGLVGEGEYDAGVSLTLGIEFLQCGQAGADGGSHAFLPARIDDDF